MLSPEVWTFPPPRSTFKERFGNISTENNAIIKDIYDFHYNHLVSVVLPDVVTVPKQLIESLAIDSEYYKLDNISISDLVEKQFIENFVRNGRITLLSIDTKIDLDDCVCLTPAGILVLSLNKNTFEGLGLEGSVSHFTHKTKDKYIVRLDIRSETFTKNQKLYQRTAENLRTRLGKFTVILAWDPDNVKVCPSSVANYFSSRGVSVELCTPRIKTRTEYQVAVPLLSEEQNKGSEMVEWLGMFTLNADCENGTPDSYTNTYQVPEPNFKYGQVNYVEWRGLFTSKKIEKLFSNVSNFVSKNGSIPWVSIYVQGFSDSPVAWGLQEHHYFTNGDSAYVIFLQPSGKYLMCTQKCSNKRYKR